MVGDGHGDWYDRTGVLKAKTVRGELEMFSNRAGKEDELGTPGSSAAAVVARKGSSRDDAPNKTGSATGSSAADSNPNSTNGQAKAALQQVSRDQPLTIAFDKFDNDETTLNILQAVVMSKLSKKKLKNIDKKYLNDAMITSIAGISAAMKNTG